MNPKILALATVLVSTASAQSYPFSCVANAGTPLIARVEGITEQVGNLLLQCTGGTPTPSGQPIPAFAVQLTLNTNVTSRILSGNTIDAVLSIDDPYPNAAELIPNTINVPQNAPTAMLCPVGSTCADTGGSGAANPYGSATNPYLNQPNTFLGTLTASNTIQWSNIPIDPPGDFGVRVLRIANVRANAAQLGLATSGPIPTQVVANVTMTGSPSPTVNNPQQTLAYIKQGLAFQGDSPFSDVWGTTVAACSTHNASLVGGSGLSAFDFHVNVFEGFAQALKRRNVSVSTDGNAIPQPAAQNIPGYAYNTETTYYAPSLFSSVGQVGLADFGSRIQVLIHNTVAGSGEHLFVPVTIQITGGDVNTALPPLAPGLNQNILRLVRTDEFGDSSPGFTPVNSTASVGNVPVAEMTYAGGSAYATYEVLNADPSHIENVTIPVAIAFDNNSINDQPTASASLLPAGGPSASIITADANAPIPRFQLNNTTWLPYLAYPCALPSPTNPVPANGATGVPLPATVQWRAAPGATSYDVYTGYGMLAVQPEKTGLTGTSYQLTGGFSGENILWRVVAHYPTGLVPSPVWSFTASAPSVTITQTHFGNFTPGQQNATYQVTISNPGSFLPAWNMTVTEDAPAGLTPVSISGAGWTCYAITCTRSDALPNGGSFPPITITVNVDPNAPAQVTNQVTLTSTSDFLNTTSRDITNILPPPTLTSPLGFFPLTPCRMVDTRTSQRQPGPLGPPSLAAATRDFPLLSSNCNIPNSAQAYSINATVVPSGPVPYLSAWPTGNPYPNVSTLNSPDGATLANAAILSAGTNGALTVLSGGPTDLILDINGYLAPPNGNELAFFPVTPCRIADTRADQHKSGAFGPPALATSATRDFPIAGTCGIPADAAAYSLNMTVVPNGPLQYLSAWPAGQAYPNVSTLNSPDGKVIANAAIVPAGANGSITVLAGGATDFIIDTNGYFAKSTLQSPGLHYYALTSPCRIADTRSSQSMQGAFGPPSLVANATRDFPILNSACNVPPEAQAYALNITVVPQGPLGYLSLWPTGQPFPGASTLNAPKGLYLANAAIVPAGTNGAITVLPSNPTDLIIDINGYFAP